MRLIPFSLGVHHAQRPQAEGNQPPKPKEATLQPRSPNRPRASTIGRGSRTISLGHGRPLSASVADHRSRTRGSKAKRPQAEGNQPPEPKEATLQPRSPNRPRASTIGRGRGPSASDTDDRSRLRSQTIGLGHGVQKQSAPKLKGINRQNPRRLLSSLDLQIGLGLRLSVAVADHQPRARRTSLGLRLSVAAANDRSRSRTIGLGRGHGPSASASDTNHRSRLQSGAWTIGLGRGHGPSGAASDAIAKIGRGILNPPRSRRIGCSLTAPGALRHTQTDSSPKRWSFLG